MQQNLSGLKVKHPIEENIIPSEVMKHKLSIRCKKPGNINASPIKTIFDASNGSRGSSYAQIGGKMESLLMWFPISNHYTTQNSGQRLSETETLGLPNS